MSENNENLQKDFTGQNDNESKESLNEKNYSDEEKNNDEEDDDYIDDDEEDEENEDEEDDDYIDDDEEDEDETQKEDLLFRDSVKDKNGVKEFTDEIKREILKGKQILPSKELIRETFGENTLVKGTDLIAKFNIDFNRVTLFMNGLAITANDEIIPKHIRTIYYISHTIGG